MLHEFKSVLQEVGPGQRRWFESDGLDLVIWLNAASDIVGFQLCYDLGAGEHALTWRPGVGFVHSRIDSGDLSAHQKLTPILDQSAGAVPWNRLVRLFAERSQSLEPDLRRLIQEQLSLGVRAGSAS